MVHLQHLQEDGTRLGLFHSKDMLYNGVYPEIMCIKALGSHIFHCLFMRSDEGEWVFEGWVPTICEDEVLWRCVESTGV